jgi:hypothetical protein
LISISRPLQASPRACELETPATIGKEETYSNSLNVSSNNLSNLLTSLEEVKSRHSTNTEFLSDIRNLININLVESDVGLILGESLDLGGDQLAGSC